MSGNDMAFPVVTEGTRTPNDTHQLGLTKRELFAAMAMQGMLAAGTGANHNDRASGAVEHADALLSALEDAQP